MAGGAVLGERDLPAFDLVGLARIEECLAAAGFTDIRITPRPESRELIATWVPGSGIENYVVSAIVEARKPQP